MLMLRDYPPKSQLRKADKVLDVLLLLKCSQLLKPQGVGEVVESYAWRQIVPAGISPSSTANTPENG